MKRWSLVVIALSLLVSGCSQGVEQGELAQESMAVVESQVPEEAPEEDADPGLDRIGSLEELLDLVNEEHEAVTKPDIRLQDYIHGESEDPYFVLNHLEGIEFNGESILPLEQVEEDLEVLFTALETTYGGYHYFGGDAAFSAARQAILDDCSQAEELTAAVFEQSLLEHLRFIRDAHLTINQQFLDSSALPYFYTQASFLLVDGVYYLEDGSKSVASVEGYADLDSLFRRSLTGKGEIVYYPVVLAEETPESLVVNFTDGSRQVLEAVPWKSQYDESERTMEVYENEGYPVLFSRNMGFDSAKDDFLQGGEFFSYAQELKEEPVLIVDLRSNGGGNGIMPLKWLSEYAGDLVTTNHISIQYWTQEALEDYGKNTESPYYIPYEEMMRYEGYESISPSYMKVGDVEEHFIPNDRLLIILTSKNTASAAETFVDAARNIENVLIVGENTYGMLVSNAYITIKLPYSGVAVQLGSNLCIFPEDDFQEYVGFAPDLWVSGDAEAAVIQMLKNWRQD